MGLENQFVAGMAGDFANSHFTQASQTPIYRSRATIA